MAGRTGRRALGGALFPAATTAPRIRRRAGDARSPDPCPLPLPLPRSRGDPRPRPLRYVRSRQGLAGLADRKTAAARIGRDCRFSVVVAAGAAVLGGYAA